MKFILMLLWLITGAEFHKADAERRLTVQTGGSITIPCHYDSQYIQHKKYWCNDVRANNHCSIRVYANETKGNIAVIDHPDQSFFTVTIRNMKFGDIGTYCCVVEIGDTEYWDVTEQLHLTVQTAPDVSVMNSSVSGDEGGNISVQCLYSSQYKTQHKQWCRYKDKKCYTSQSSSVQIRDDGSGSFTVMMSGLMLTDSGWYFCSVGALQAPVQLTVTPKTDADVSLTLTETSRSFTVTGAPSVTRNSSTRVSIHAASVPNNSKKTSSVEEQQDILQYDDLKMWLPLTLLLLVPMVILVAVVMVIIRKKRKRNKTHITHQIQDQVSHAEDSVIFSSVNPECDVTYSSVIKFSKTKACRPVCADDTVIYSSV